MANESAISVGNLDLLCSNYRIAIAAISLSDIQGLQVQTICVLAKASEQCAGRKHEHFVQLAQCRQLFSYQDIVLHILPEFAHVAQLQGLFGTRSAMQSIR